MTFDKSDEYISDCVAYALANKPCIIACHTVQGMMDMRLQLAFAGHRAGFIRVATSHLDRLKGLFQFETGLTDYLVVADHIMFDIKSTRAEAHLAIASLVTGDRAAMYAQSIKDPARVFVKVRQG